MAFVDTSVLVAYLCPEPLHAATMRALNAASVRIVSPLVQVELASALAMKVRTGQSDKASARAVLAQYHQLVADNLFTLREITTANYQQAHDWLASLSTQLRTLGAIHLACAAANKKTLLTADKVLAQSAKTLGVSCKLIAL